MAIDPTTVKVALLGGGKSGEREISLASARGAGEALRQAGFEVTPIDPASTADLARLVQEPFDVAFLCLHGKWGEDGTVQGMLEVLGIPYTGPGVWSSATAMDKALSKERYSQAGIPTPASVILKRGEPYDADALFSQVGSPLVVKPATEGSALGVSIVNQGDDLGAAIAAAHELDAQVLVESFVDGIELTVAVVGNEDPQAFPVIQIVPQKNDFYDFDSKYAPGGSDHLCPAPLSDKKTAEVQDLALRAHCALKCRGMSRTDIMLDGQDRPWVLETNTIPGMTETSLLPDAARAAGIEFPELCTRLVELALESPR